MDIKFPKAGLFQLTSEEIFSDVLEWYQRFIAEQTPINAFWLSIGFLHLEEWIIADQPGRQERQLSDRLREMKYWSVLKSLANNSKHYLLTRSTAYEKGIRRGFVAGRSVAGEKLGQVNLVVFVGDSEVWLREVFEPVIREYMTYFERKGLLCLIEDIVAHADG